MFDICYKTPRKPYKSPQIARSSELPMVIPSKFFKNPNYKPKKWSLPDKNPEKPDFPQGKWVLESPFCRLLNESEREPFEKYQVLGRVSENPISDKEVRSFREFFQAFNARSEEILRLFHENSIFEIIGEEICSFDKTIKALANNFSDFQIKDESQIFVDEITENNEDFLIISSQGFARTFAEKVFEFVVSCKFSAEKIKETKLKLLWN